MKKAIALLTILAAPFSHALRAADPLDLQMPSKGISLGWHAEFIVGEDGLRLMVLIGYLEPGWYKLKENGLAGLARETNRYFPNDDINSLLGFYVGEGTEKGQRFAKVTEARYYQFAITLRTRENQLRVYPAGKFNHSAISNYGSAIDASIFEGYPDCAYIRELAPAGEKHYVEYMIERVEEGAVPPAVRSRINALHGT